MSQSKVLMLILTLVAVVGMAAVMLHGTELPAANSGNPTLQAEDNTDLVFYYGSTCPHCQQVEAWIEENQVDKKIQIEKKEVYGNKTNAQELNQVAQGCGILRSEVAVPFLKTEENKCLIGSPEVIGYLAEKAGISTPPPTGETPSSDDLK